MNDDNNNIEILEYIRLVTLLYDSLKYDKVTNKKIIMIRCIVTRLSGIDKSSQDNLYKYLNECSSNSPDIDYITSLSDKIYTSNGIYNKILREFMD